MHKPQEIWVATILKAFFHFPFAFVKLSLESFLLESAFCQDGNHRTKIVIAVAACWLYKFLLIESIDKLSVLLFVTCLIFVLVLFLLIDKLLSI